MEQYGIFSCTSISNPVRAWTEIGLIYVIVLRLIFSKSHSRFSFFYVVCGNLLYLILPCNLLLMPMRI